MKKVVRLTEADLVRIVKRVIEEQEDIQWMRDDENPENMYYKTPGADYWYDKDDRRGPKEDIFDFDFDEEEYDEFDDFITKYPYVDDGGIQNWFPNNSIGRSWFKHYKRDSGGRFPIRVRRKK